MFSKWLSFSLEVILGFLLYVVLCAAMVLTEWAVRNLVVTWEAGLWSRLRIDALDFAHGVLIIFLYLKFIRNLSAKSHTSARPWWE